MRWIIRGAGAVLVVVLLAVAALFALPTERIAALATDRLGAALDREVTISGSVSPTLWPSLGVRVEGVRVGNPDWVTDGPLIAAEAMSVRVPWTAILNAEAAVEEITLIAPDIALVRDAEGRASWTIGANGDAEAAAAEGGRTAFSLDRARIENGRIVFVDAGAGTRTEITGIDADLALPASGPATLGARATVDGAELTLDLRVDGIADFAAGALRPLTAALGWSGGTLDFVGAASLDPSLEGDLDLAATDFGPLAGLAGLAAPDLPAGFGRDALSLTGRVSLTNAGTAHLRDAILEMDDNRLALALDVEPGEMRPMIRLTARGEALTIARSAPAPAGPQDGWSTEPIDVSGLFAADAEIAFSAGRLDLGDYALGPLSLRISNTDGRAVVAFERFEMFGGSLAGDVVVNGRGGLSTRADLIVAGVAFEPLLATFAGTDRLQGSGSMSLQVLGVGDSMAALMRSLEGAGDMALGAGSIRGLDLAEIARTLDPSFQGVGAETVYDRVTANFTIAAGVLRNDDLRLDAPWGEVTGAGLVDLGQRTLDYRVIPALPGVEVAGRAVEVPILIRGPWSAPGIRPDLEYLARQELDAQAARLEEEARRRIGEQATRLEEEATRRANEALGLDLQTGGGVEGARDAVEERLREAAQNQLRGLLSGN